MNRTIRRSSIAKSPPLAALGLSVALLLPRAARAQAQPEPIPPAQAQPAPAETPSAEPPWYQGVSEERRQKAKALFQEARELHRALILGEARDKYEEALKYWEHPQLRLYLGRALMRIGLPLLAYESLQRVMKWGPGALDPEEEKEALGALRELEQKHLGVISIRCDEPGAEVLLDGSLLFKGAGEGRRMILPGDHVISARKKGSYATVRSVAVTAGKKATVVIHLSVDTTLSQRRWAAWKPWALVGTGAALGALGGGLLALSSSDYDRTVEGLRQKCALTCPPDTSGAYSRIQVENGLAIGSLVVGGAALLGGSAMVILNLPQPYRTKDESDVKVDVVPLLSASSAGLSTRVSF
jgi:tetratricopeptide (TPR) repeat protein